MKSHEKSVGMLPSEILKRDSSSMSIMKVGGKKVRGRFPSAGLDTTTRDSTQKSAKEKKKSSIRRTNVETLLTFCGRDIIFLFFWSGGRPTAKLWNPVYTYLGIRGQGLFQKWKPTTKVWPPPSYLFFPASERRLKPLSFLFFPFSYSIFLLLPFMVVSRNIREKKGSEGRNPQP